MLTGVCWLAAGCATHLGNGPDHGLTAVSRLHLAEAAEAAGDQQTAASMYLAAANAAGADKDVELRSAEGLARTNRIDDAEGVLARRLQAEPKDVDALRTLGAAQVMAGKPSQAVQTLSGVLKIKPNDQAALVNEAVALDILQRHREAQNLYRQALAQSPGDVATSNDLALSLLLSGRLAEAQLVLSPFRSAAALPERMKTNLGIIDAVTGRPTDAKALLGSKIDATDLASLTQAIGRQRP